MGDVLVDSGTLKTTIDLLENVLDIVVDDGSHVDWAEDIMWLGSIWSWYDVRRHILTELKDSLEVGDVLAEES